MAGFSESYEQAAEFIDSIRDLPSLPDIVHEVLSAASGETENFVQIARLVERDLGLSARVLKIANSPFYSRSRPTANVSVAIARMGTEEFKAVAFSASVMNSFQELRTLIDLPAFWDHGMAAALACQLLASPEELGKDPSMEIDALYMSGLLHHAGILAEAMKEPGAFVKARTLSVNRSLPLHEVEREVFGFDHAQAGAALLRKWRFPEEVCEAILRHHEHFSGSNHLKTVHATRLASLLCRPLDPLEDQASEDSAPWFDDPSFGQLGWMSQHAGPLTCGFSECVQRSSDFRELVLV